MSVIMWTIAAGTIIFGVGLTSAIRSRREQKKVTRRKIPISIAMGEIRTNEMSEAAAGTNRIWAAQPGDGALVGVGQGKEK